jgi:transcriptional regulator GlxA family with amidase domain
MGGTEAPARRRAATTEAYGSIFDAAVQILVSEFPRPLRIEEVAQRVAISPRQLQRVFPEVGGLGFRAYLTRIRMRHAADLLATTDLPVKEIGRRVGYGEASQFSKAFKRIHDVSPSQARSDAAAKLTLCTQPHAVKGLGPRVPDFGRQEVSDDGSANT